MRKFVLLMFFPAFYLALAMLPSVSDFAVGQTSAAAQTNNNSGSRRKPNDSVSDTWQVTISESKMLTAAITTGGKTPNGEAQTMFQMECRADSSSVALIAYIVLDAFELKSFKFSDFEGPDAPAQLEKLVEFRASSPTRILTSLII